ncbi:MAG: hypothetical protein WAQ33_05320, partial [Gaiellaceae bacterium]
MTEPNEDTWERDDWDLGGAVELGREEVLRLARHLAEQHARLRDEELAEFTNLKRELRERAAEVAARELEVEQTRAGLEEREAELRADRRHGLRFRRERPHEVDTDSAYAEELNARRESEVKERLVEVVSKEREIRERDEALRQRAMELDEREHAQTAQREQLEARARELDETGETATREREELERLRGQAARTSDELAARAA